MNILRPRVLQSCFAAIGVLWVVPLALCGCNSSGNVPLTAEPVAMQAAVTAPAAPPEAPPFDARKLFDLEDTRINESSGLAASRRYPGVLWTHNDSGDAPRVFMVASDGENAGKTLAEVKLEGATATDWEDMAVAGTGIDSWVYVGDIGDNLRKRDAITVYRFREPEVDIAQTSQTLSVRCAMMTLKYPDGAHDAETLMATPGGTLLIVSKTASGESVMYKTPRPFDRGTQQELVRVGEYKFEASGMRSRLTTGGDYCTVRRSIVVRTYTKAYEWKLPDEDGWAQVWPGTPEIVTLPETVQGEAICYSPDGQKLYTTSEQLPAPLHELTRRPE